MDKASDAKQDVLKLITENFGQVTAQTFDNFYGDETLPIFFDAALNILKDLIGKTKTQEILDTILTKHALKPFYS